jgi:hypothetical protein
MHRNARMRRLKFILDYQTVFQSLVDLRKAPDFVF